MTSVSFVLFISGAILLGYVVIGGFFWRFWRNTRDRLFAWFALSFWLLAIERILLVSGGSENNPGPAIYLTRLVAYLILIAAIVGKNRKAPPRAGE